MDNDGYVVGPQEYPVVIQIDEAKFESGRSIVYAHDVHITLATKCLRQPVILGERTR